MRRAARRGARLVVLLALVGFFFCFDLDETPSFIGVVTSAGGRVVPPGPRRHDRDLARARTTSARDILTLGIDNAATASSLVRL